MDYVKIGQNIRTARKHNMISQEELAEKVGISVTHMSHIETGNTKLSLQVLADLAEALGVTMDTLVNGVPEEVKRKRFETMCDLMQTCTSKEWSVLMDIMEAACNSMKRYSVLEEDFDN